MLAAARDLANRRVAIEIDRVGAVKFWGWSEWTRRSPSSDTVESCYVEITSKLSPTGIQHTETRSLQCEEAPPSAPSAAGA